MMQRRGGTGSWWVMAAAMAITAIAIAGCGSDSESTAPPEAKTPNFTGKPIKIATITGVNTPIGSLTEVFAGVEAAARGINQEGGINGRELVVTTCNGKFDPNQEVACARKVVREGAIAVVGSLMYANVPGAEQVLSEGNVTDLASSGVLPESFQSPNQFPIDFPYGELFACASGALATAAADSTELRLAIGEGPAAKAQIAQFTAAAQHLGTDLQPPVSVGLTATDFSSTIQQLANQGDGLVTISLSPPQTLAFPAAAVSAGRNWPLCTAADILPPDEAAKFGSSLELYVGSPFPSLSESEKYPLIKEYVQQMGAEADAGNTDAASGLTRPRALRAWLGVQVVKDVAEKIDGPITARSFLAAISKAKVDLDGVVPPLDFAKPIGGGAYPRLFNATSVVKRWDAGQEEFVPIPDIEPVNTIEAVLPE